MASTVPVNAASSLLQGVATALSPDEKNRVAPGARFRMEAPLRLVDARLSLLDESDALVVSTATTEVGSGWTRFEVAPSEDLRPGSAYLLRLEGAVTRELHDEGGHAYGPYVVRFETSGERPPRPVEKKLRRRR